MNNVVYIDPENRFGYIYTAQDGTNKKFSCLTEMIEYFSDNEITPSLFMGTLEQCNEFRAEMELEELIR